MMFRISISDCTRFMKLVWLLLIALFMTAGSPIGTGCHIQTAVQAAAAQTDELIEDTVSDTPSYEIRVNQTTCVVTIYADGEPVKAMLCSVGLDDTTPDGTFSLGEKLQWHALYGPSDTIVYGQYVSRITGHILFHSVYYTRYQDNHSLASAEFRKLGSAASHGCVRLACGDAYFIYANCPAGTPVTIFHGTGADDLLGKPDNAHENWTGDYDPTDPDPND